MCFYSFLFTTFWGKNFFSKQCRWFYWQVMTVFGVWLQEYGAEEKSSVEGKVVKGEHGQSAVWAVRCVEKDGNPDAVVFKEWGRERLEGSHQCICSEQWILRFQWILAYFKYKTSHLIQDPWLNSGSSFFSQWPLNWSWLRPHF